MSITRKTTLILSLLAGVLILFPAVNAYAARCLETRFVIEDEVSGEEIGLIYTESLESRQEICLQGIFLDKKYQYLYRCDKTGRYKFIKKFKTEQKGCRWGKIH